MTSTATVNQAPPACTILRPDVDAAPVIFASPHSGRHYPRDFREMLDVPLMDLRRTEDAYIDELFSPALSRGATLIQAIYPRSYVDLNRDARELDAAMFGDGLPRTAGMPTAHVRAGLGCLPRIGSMGRNIYRAPLTKADGTFRLKHVHDGYHAALKAEIARLQIQAPHVILIDCHSMPSRQPGRDALPDIILGDRFGSSCAAQLISVCENNLKQQGLSVKRNAPYAGGYTTRFYGRPKRGVHVLQIEINRGLYLDEEFVEKSMNFNTLKEKLHPLISAIITLSRTL